MGEAEAIAAAPAPPRKPSGMFSYLLLIVFLVVIYVLSLGPAVKYYRTHPGTAASEAIRTIYDPIVRLGMISPPIAELLARYIDLWVRDN